MILTAASRPVRARSPLAFTLMETIVALGLLLVLVGSVFAFATNLSSSRDRLSRHLRQSQAVRVFLDRIEQDLRTSLAADAALGGGVVGRESSIVILSRGVGLIGQGSSATALGDLQRSEYRWNDGASVLEARRGGAADQGAWHSITGDLGLVQWRYHDGNGWSTSFDSGASNRLPVAVEVAIWFTPPPRDQATAAAMPAIDEGARVDPFGLRDNLDGRGSPQPSEDDEVLEDESRRNWPPPDRVRLIIVPDAPAFEYGRRYEDDADLPVATDAPSDGGV